MVPFFFATIKQENGSETIARMVTLYVAAVLLAALTLNAFSYEVIHLIATERFWGSWKTVPLLVLGFSFHALYYVPGSVLLYTKKTHHQAKVAVLVAVGSLGLNFLLAPPYGAYGVAVTVVVTYLCLFLGNFILAGRYLKIPYEYSRVSKLLVSFAGIYLVTVFVNVTEVKYVWAWKTALVGLFPTSLYILGFFNEQEKEWIKGLSPRGLFHLP